MSTAPSGAAVLAVVFTLVAVAFAIIVARIYLRLVIQKQRLVPADWIRIVAWLSAFATASFDIVYTVEGSLDPANNYTLVNWDVPPEKLERVLKITWASMIPFFTTFYLCKASLLVVYLQLFPPFMNKRRMVLWAVVVYCVCAFIASICLQLFLCFPIERNWSVMDPEKVCDDWSLVTTFQVAWALHFIGSLALFALPFLVLYKLNMRPKVKIELWSALDVYIGLIIACLPALRPYLRRKGSKYSYGESARPTGSSAHPVRRTADRGFQEIDETPSLEGGSGPGPWAVSNSPELGATGWTDKKSNSSDVELVSLDVTAAKDRMHV
ncbi:hypothetical protein FLONG3_10871 [Fusarium longipes]|uniref:Rhodopsin domain-containing protein n=1 Tax=Fusarium longipes TaxID=694270 RepID=A0A395RJZ7_9HYPO|nr:hypothetical protein FLONG3_10871 [Fusarium longipes]